MSKPKDAPTVIEGKIQLPAAWKRLVKMDFPENLDGVSNGDHSMRPSTKTGDPSPYYDDLRTCEQMLPDGNELITELASGQSNYYAGHIVYGSEEGRLLFQTQPFHSFGDEEIVGPVDRKPVGKRPAEVEYHLTVDWIEDWETRA